MYCTNFWSVIASPLNLLYVAFTSWSSQAKRKKNLKDPKAFFSEGLRPVCIKLEIFRKISRQNIWTNSSFVSIIKCKLTRTMDMYSAEFFGRFSRILVQTSIKCIEMLICWISLSNCGNDSAEIFLSLLVRLVTLFNEESLVEDANSIL